MDETRLLQLYDAEMRRDPPLSPGLRAERAGKRLRLSGPYTCIVHSELSEDDADDEIEREVAHLRQAQASLEWKVHAHDRPADLGQRLRRAGFRPEPPETLLARTIGADLDALAASGDVVMKVARSEQHLDDFLFTVRAAFGTDFSDNRNEMAARMAEGRLSLHLAYADGRPIGAGRLDMPADRSFAGLYTGGVAPGHRSRGVYRALVRSRAREAAARGYRFLFSEAAETSRPILERLGFRRLTTVQGWTFEP